MEFAELTAQARRATEELLEKAHLETGDIFVVGCSSSEIMGGQIGHDSSMDAAAAVPAGVLPPLQEQGVYLAAQCCEHLNRAIVLEREAARAYIRSLEPDLPIVESHNGNADFASLPERALRLFPVGFNTPETRPDCFALEAVRTDAKTLLDALTADGNVLRVKGYIRAADGVRFVSDTGQGFETMESRDAPMPLMIICMQGTAGAVRAALHAAGIA